MRLSQKQPKRSRQLQKANLSERTDKSEGSCRLAWSTAGTGAAQLSPTLGSGSCILSSSCSKVFLMHLHMARAYLKVTQSMQGQDALVR